MSNYIYIASYIASFIATCLCQLMQICKVDQTSIIRVYTPMYSYIVVEAQKLNYCMNVIADLEVFPKKSLLKSMVMGSDGHLCLSAVVI